MDIEAARSDLVCALGASDDKDVDSYIVSALKHLTENYEERHEMYTTAIQARLERKKSPRPSEYTDEPGQEGRRGLS